MQNLFATFVEHHNVKSFIKLSKTSLSQLISIDIISYIIFRIKCKTYISKRNREKNTCSDNPNKINIYVGVQIRPIGNIYKSILF